MQDFILRSGIQFSDEDKKKCISIAHRMVYLAHLSYQEGILSIRDTANDSEFMKMAVNLTLSNMAPRLIEKTFQYYILSNECSGADLLEKLIIIEGLQVIMASDNWIGTTSTVAHLVGAMLGEKYMPEILSKADDFAKREPIDTDALIAEYTSPLPESGSMHFEREMLKLTKAELSYVSLTMGHVILSSALKGCNKSFIHYMKNSVSEISFEEICRLFKDFASLSEEQISAEQYVILNHILQLECSGIITEKTDAETSN